MSKLLARLDAGIAQANDDVLRGELLARKAGYLARIGSFEQAQDLISQLRASFGDGRSPRVSIWIMLAEGLFRTYRDMSDEGADRIMRAHALANATRDRPLIAAISAWRAHTQSERSEFKGMARSLDDALANAETNDHEVLARVYMVLANAHMSVGSRERAHDNYMYSRHHALECGDQATIDALIYNKAAFGLAWLRARMCFEESDPEHLGKIRIELASAKTYQQMAGLSALTNFVYLWEARLLLLSGDFDAAVEALRAVQSMQPFAAYNYNVALIELEIGYCLMRLGRLQSGQAPLDAALSADCSALHTDDQLVAAWLRVQLFSSFSMTAEAQAASAVLDVVRSAFVASSRDLQEVLGGLREHSHIVRPEVIQSRAAP